MATSDTADPDRVTARLDQTLQDIYYVVRMFAFFVLVILCFSAGNKYLTGIVIAGPFLVGVMKGVEKGPHSILMLACAAFVLGQRTVHFGNYVRVVPSEAILWLLALLCLPRPKPQLLLKTSMPFAVLILCGCLLLGFFSRRPEYPWDFNLAVAYSKGLWLSLPVFFVISHAITRSEQYRRLFYLMAIECLFLSILSVAEVYDLPFIHALPGFYGEKHVVVDFAEFTRSFSGFWGNPMLGGMIAIWFPILLYQWNYTKTPIRKLIIGSALTLSVLCIYYSGFRGVWGSLVVSLAAFYYLKGLRKTFAFLLLLGVAVQFMPETAIERMSAVQGEDQDSSTLKRLHRMHVAWEMIKERPFLGSGWGASGLVHSDYLQLWADCGLPAPLAFLAVMLAVLKRLYSSIRLIDSMEQRECLYAFIASVLMVFLILTNQPFFNLPEQYPPLWVLMALAYQYPNVIRSERESAQP